VTEFERVGLLDSWYGRLPGELSLSRFLMCVVRGWTLNWDVATEVDGEVFEEGRDGMGTGVCENVFEERILEYANWEPAAGAGFFKEMDMMVYWLEKSITGLPESN